MKKEHLWELFILKMMKKYKRFIMKNMKKKSSMIYFFVYFHKENIFVT